MCHKMIISFIVLLSLCLVAPAQSIKIVKPHGGENLYLGQEQIITWTSSGLQGSVAVHVLAGETLKGVIAENHDVNGSVLWQVGQSPVSGEPLPPGVYRIRVVSMQNTAIKATSKEFTVNPAVEAYIAIDLPRMHEVWMAGSKQTIRWHSNGIRQPIMLQLLKGETPLLIICTDQSPSGQYEWTVGHGKKFGTDTPSWQNADLYIQALPQTGGSDISGRSHPIRIIGKAVFLKENEVKKLREAPQKD